MRTQVGSVAAAAGVLVVAAALLGGCGSQDTRRKLDALRRQIEEHDREIAALDREGRQYDALVQDARTADDRQLRAEHRDKVKRRRAELKAERDALNRQWEELYAQREAEMRESLSDPMGVRRMREEPLGVPLGTGGTGAGAGSTPPPNCPPGSQP